MTKDLISRQDAIRLAEQGQIQGFEWQFKKLCALPSAEPQKKGRWIKKEPTIKELHGCYYECSKCHKFSLPFQKLNFCPNCGADMRGEQNEAE